MTQSVANLALQFGDDDAKVSKIQYRDTIWMDLAFNVVNGNNVMRLVLSLVPLYLMYWPSSGLPQSFVFLDYEMTFSIIVTGLDVSSLRSCYALRRSGH